MAMKAIDRKAALLRKGITISQIARDIGLTSQHVGQVVAGERRSETVEKAIADAIGKPVRKVFGKPRKAVSAAA